MQALVIHESFLTRTILGGILLEQDFEVYSAKRAAEALDQLDAGLRPDVVLLGFYLPGSACSALMAEIRRRCDAKLVLVTGHADPCLADSALAARADDYLHRPRTLAAVRGSLQRLGLAAPAGPRLALAC
jgi:two-component system chemotaxis response regulator CheY